MADETIGENLDRLGNEGRLAKDAFTSLKDEVNALKQGMNQAVGFTDDLTRALTNGKNAGKKLADIVEEIKEQKISTRDLQRESTKQIALQKDLQNKVSELQAKASTATSTQKDALTKSAILMADAAREAGLLAQGFAEAAQANAKLNKNAQFFDRS